MVFPSSWVALLVVVNLFLQVWDGCATYYGLSQGVQEGNPLLRSCMEYWGVRVTLRVARSPAPNYPKPPRPGSLAPNVGDHGPSDSALAAASGWRLHRLAADRHAARCASRDLCSGARHSAPCALE